MSEYLTMLEYNDQARSRIHDGIRKYSKIVNQARTRGINERDTADIVKAIIGDMLGYDPFFDVTADASVRGAWADYAVLLDERLQFLISVKSISVLPEPSHLARLTGAAAPAYAQWILLTNADDWCCYRLGVGPDRHVELVFRVSLLDDTPIEEKLACFFLVSKEGMQEDALTFFWESRRVLHPGRLATLILSDEVLQILRRELQRTVNYRIDRRSLHDILVREVLRPEAMSSAAAPFESASLSLPDCYAYVRNASEPNSWRLRYRHADGSASPDLLAAAVNELTVEIRALGIPADDLPLVKERLRRAYEELDIAPTEMPSILAR